MKRERGGFRMLRHEQLLQELVHDTYKSGRKLPEPTRCQDCGAVWHRGRWSWGAPPAGAHVARCPACKRIRDRFPAGYVSLQGKFFDAHRDEIVGRVRNCEAAEKADHPLQRIMNIEPEAGGLLVTTTDAHLARGIGEALRKAYRGRMEFHYNKADNLLRVSWTR
jgi:NMD protein affecting ribosome stability and mRNA decay